MTAHTSKFLLENHQHSNNLETPRSLYILSPQVFAHFITLDTQDYGFDILIPYE